MAPIKVGNRIQTKSTFKRADKLAVGHIAELREREGKWPIINTVLPTLDVLFGGGLSPGVHYLAGAPGVSKTACALQLARKAASEGWPTYFISLELQVGDLLDRMVCQETGLSWFDIRAGRYTDEAEEVSWQLADLPLYFAEETDKFQKVMQDLYAIKEPSLIILDYLQIGADMWFKGDPREKVSSLCKLLHKFTKETNHPLLAISSMARTKYTSKVEPTPASCLAAAKESGDVEYYATSLSVLFPQNDVEENPRPGYWILAKNRFGRVGKIRISIDAKRGLIEESDEFEIRDEDTEHNILEMLMEPPYKLPQFSEDKERWSLQDVIDTTGRNRGAVGKKLKDLIQRGLVKLADKFGYRTTKKGIVYLETKGVLKDKDEDKEEEEED